MIVSMYLSRMSSSARTVISMNEEQFESFLKYCPPALNLPGYLQEKEAAYLRRSFLFREFVEWVDIHYPGVNLELWPLFFLGFVIIKGLDEGAAK
jgi:hypothetical protein